MRVTAFDGVDTSEDFSDGHFAIENEPSADEACVESCLAAGHSDGKCLDISYTDSCGSGVAPCLLGTRDPAPCMVEYNKNCICDPEPYIWVMAPDTMMSCNAICEGADSFCLQSNWNDYNTETEMCAVMNDFVDVQAMDYSSGSTSPEYSFTMKKCFIRSSGVAQDCDFMSGMSVKRLCACNPADQNHPPVVDVLFPNGGEVLSGKVTVTWDGEDPDGDELFYLAYFENEDNGNSYPLFRGTYDESFDVYTDLYPDGENYKMKVIADDGSETATDYSDDYFAIFNDNATNNPPSVRVVFPNGGEVLRGTITARWDAFDPDGDDLIFNVYLHDDWLGASYLIVEGTERHSVNIDTSRYPESELYKLEVLVSDGEDLNKDWSDGHFAISHDFEGGGAPADNGLPQVNSMVVAVAVYTITVVGIVGAIEFFGLL
jgi:hypothetical protein